MPAATLARRILLVALSPENDISISGVGLDAGQLRPSKTDSVWDSLANPPDLESGDRRFESSHADHDRLLPHLVERHALNVEVPGSKPGGAANQSVW